MFMPGAQAVDECVGPAEWDAQGVQLADLGHDAHIAV